MKLQAIGCLLLSSGTRRVMSLPSPQETTDNEFTSGKLRKRGEDIIDHPETSLPTRTREPPPSLGNTIDKFAYACQLLA
jgi:hypothetical protein